MDKIHIRWLEIKKMLPVNPHVAIGVGWEPPFEIVNILQQKNGHGNWIDVPTVEEEDEKVYWTEVFADKSRGFCNDRKDLYENEAYCKANVKFSKRQCKMILEVINARLEEIDAWEKND